MESFVDNKLHDESFLSTRDLLTASPLPKRVRPHNRRCHRRASCFLYLFLARLVLASPGRCDYFFLLVGTGFTRSLVMSVEFVSFYGAGAQRTGTPEVLMTTATPPAMLVFLTPSGTGAQSGGKSLLRTWCGRAITVPSPRRSSNVVGCASSCLSSRS